MSMEVQLGRASRCSQEAACRAVRDVGRIVEGCAGDLRDGEGKRLHHNGWPAALWHWCHCAELGAVAADSFQRLI